MTRRLVDNGFQRERYGLLDIICVDGADLFNKQMKSWHSLLDDFEHDADIVIWPSFSTPLKSETRHQHYTVGSHLPSAAEEAIGNEEEADEFTAFLDRALKEAGTQSVLYICFGSIVLPPSPS